MPTTGIRARPEFPLVLLNSSLEFGTEVADETLDGPGEGLTQCADGVTLDLLGEFLEHVDLTFLGVAGLETLHHLQGPLATLTAGCALTTTLVLVEARKTTNGADDVGALVHNDDGGGTQTGLGVLQAIKVHDLVVADGLGDNGSRRSTGDDGKEVVPATTHTTAVLLDQVAQGDGHLLFDGDGVVDMTRDTEQLGTDVTLTAQ